MDNMLDIVTCLDALTPFVTIAGVLFVYGGGRKRMMAHDLATIQWVKCFCGPEFFRRVTIVTSQWDSLSEDDFAEAWLECLPDLLQDPVVREILYPVRFGPRRYWGGTVYHHSIKGGSRVKKGVIPKTLSVRRRRSERAAEVRAMIKARYGSPPEAQLQVVREMAAGLPWYQTEAAKVLDYSPRSITLQVVDDFARVYIMAKPRPYLKGAADPAQKFLDKPSLPRTDTARNGSSSGEAVSTTPSPRAERPPPETSKDGVPGAPDAPDDEPRPAPKKERPETKTSWLDKLASWLQAFAKSALFFLWEAPKSEQCEENSGSGRNVSEVSQNRRS